MAVQQKRKETFKMSFRKNTRWGNIDAIVRWLKQKEIVVYQINQGENSDDTEFITIKIDGIK